MRLTVMLAALTATLGSGPAMAQNETTRGISGSIGMGVGAVRDYDGGDKTRAVPAIMLEAQLPTRVGTFALGRQGLSWTPIEGEKFNASLFATYDNGRKEDDDDEFQTGSKYLKGMGEIEGTTEGGLLLKYHMGRFGLSLSGRHALGSQGHDGAVVDLGASVMLHEAPKFRLTAETTVSWVDDNYMQTYYGVTREQARRTRFPVYEIDGGVNGARIEFTGVYNFAPRWSLIGLASYRKLLGDAADSPIVQSDGYPEFAVMVSRAWGKSQ